MSDAKNPKPSDMYIDALDETLDAWIDRNLPPGLAAELKDAIAESEDVLVGRIVELTGIEMRRAFRDAAGEQTP